LKRYVARAIFAILPGQQRQCVSSRLSNCCLICIGASNDSAGPSPTDGSMAALFVSAEQRGRSGCVNLPWNGGLNWPALPLAVDVSAGAALLS
jgi:hypothetical protein